MNILNKLTIKHLLMNKKRTIVTIIGIILSTALMTGIGALASTFRDNSLEQVKIDQGDYHVKMANVPATNIHYLENHADIEKVLLEQEVGYAILPGSQNEYKPYLYVEKVNDTVLNNVKLLSGRLPKNDTEVLLSEHIASNGKVTYHLGDPITLDLGKRVLSEEMEGCCQIDQHLMLQEGETFSSETTKTYTVVGFMERQNLEPYSAPGYTVFTKLDGSVIEDQPMTATITYKSVKNVHQKTTKLAALLDLPYQAQDNRRVYNLDYNEVLLSFYGESSYTSINETFVIVIVIVLSLIMIGCAIVIYNSFAISVMERKKQFGLFASIGATKRQLKKTVFFEAFIVSLIGIPIGVLSGILGIAIVIAITNHLLPNIFAVPFKLSLYPLFILIPILYMIATILLSAYLPARQASKISPIEAIRLSDDIKLTKRKIRRHPLISKLFGIEGDIARKNMLRNKKKYRITILSLVVSIVLFVSFSTFVEYVSFSSSNLLNVPMYDIVITKERNDDPQTDYVIEEMLETKGIDEGFQYTQSHVLLDHLVGTTKKFNDFVDTIEQQNAILIVLKDEDYQDYLQKLHLNPKDYTPSQMRLILVNPMVKIDDEKMKVNHFDVYPNKKARKVTLVRNYLDEEETTATTFSELERKEFNVSVVDTYPKDYLEFDQAMNIKFVVSQSMLDFLNANDPGYSTRNYMKTLILAKDHDQVTKELKKIQTTAFGEHDDHLMIIDYTAELQLEKNLITVIGMFLYGFIALVTLIGVTSVFNTINTSMALRRREFAVLRSVGLTPKGFNKMLRYESILYGIKSLLIGLPISLLVVVLFHVTFMDVVNFDSILIPWKAIAIAIVAVFLIVFITMQYATSKIKKENILDAIREENI